MTEREERVPTPRECIEDMFRRTDANGALFLPRLHLHTAYPGLDIYGACCHMTWTQADCEAVIQEAETLIGKLRRLTAIFHDETRTPLEMRKLFRSENTEPLREMLPPELFEVWDTYLKELIPEGFCEAEILKIVEKVGILYRLGIDEELIGDDEASEETIEWYEANQDTCLTEEESELFARYARAVPREAERRIGEGAEAFEVIYHAQSLFQLSAALPINIESDETDLAKALAIHRFSDSVMKILRDAV